MKNILLAITLIMGLATVSCKKEETAAPQNPSAPKTINVEYRISSQSGLVNASYLFPNAAGELEMVTQTISRNYFIINFDHTSGNLFSVEASNVNPAYKTVQVEIYVNGELKAKGISTSPSQKAIAQGNY